MLEESKLDCEERKEESPAELQDGDWTKEHYEIKDNKSLCKFHLARLTDGFTLTYNDIKNNKEL